MKEQGDLTENESDDAEYWFQNAGRETHKALRKTNNQTVVLQDKLFGLNECTPTKSPSKER